MNRRLLLVALLASTVIGRAGAAEPEIQWRVENPFRFFTDAVDTEMHRATFLALSEEGRRTPVLNSERALGERHQDGWAAHIGTKICWSMAKNRHVCPDGSEYIHPKAHVILAEINGIEDAADVDCSWHIAGSASAAIKLPCTDRVKLTVPFPAGARITVEIGGRAVTETLAKVTDLLIAGIGDSFASGEGNPDAPVRFSRERSADYSDGKKGQELSGFPARIGSWQKIGDPQFIRENARWLDQACHRSLYSHQLRTALQLSFEHPHRAVTYLGFGCSGAETTFGLFLLYKGNEWVPTPPDQPQISAVAREQCGRRPAPAHDLPEAYHMSERLPELKQIVLLKCESEHARRIDLLLVSIGGNDMGFARLVANAVFSDTSALKRLGGWFGQVYDFKDAMDALELVDDRYKSLNRAIHSILHVPWGESDRVILTAYPPLAVLEDGKSVCPDGKAGMTVLSEFALSSQRAERGGIAAERLNEIMRNSARQHGWSFVDAHRSSFAGRGICAGASEQAISLAEDLRLPRKVGEAWEPFNPADWRAYVPRQRWFRTPNDAFMTGNFHVSQSLLQSVMKMQGLSWFQLLLASTYSGAFHPTAEGQAAIADAVVTRARAVLDKYGRARGG